METAVYLSWLTWPHKWQCCLTDIEWDMYKKDKLPSWQWPLSVSLYLNTYSIHTCRALWRSGYSLPLWIEWSWVRVSAAVVWHCVLGQGTPPPPHVHSLDLTRSGVNGYLHGTWLDSDCWCVWIVPSAVVTTGAVCSPGTDQFPYKPGEKNWKQLLFCHWLPSCLNPPPTQQRGSGQILKHLLYLPGLICAALVESAAQFHSTGLLCSVYM